MKGGDTLRHIDDVFMDSLKESIIREEIRKDHVRWCRYKL